MLSLSVLKLNNRYKGLELKLPFTKISIKLTTSLVSISLIKLL